MSIKAHFLSTTAEDARLTIDWLNRAGISKIDTLEQLVGHDAFEISLRDTPDVLHYFAQLEDSVSVLRITNEGIVFYLTNIPIRYSDSERKDQVRTDRPDGCLFCPMSNVICINTFGNIYALKSTVL